MGASAQLLEAEGISRLSMRRVGRALGVEGMALYRHFASKRALLEAVVEDALATYRPSFEGSPRWEERLRAWAWALRRLGSERPEAYGLLMTMGLGWPGLQSYVEEAADIFAEARLSPERTADALRVTIGFVTGFVLWEAKGALASQPPRSVRLSDASFDFGLDVIIRGLEEQAGSQGGGRADGSRP